MSDKQEEVEAAVENMLNEWKRAMLSWWVLALITIRSMYGLEIAKEIEDSTQGRMTVGASTIYQLLRRLERRGLIVESGWEKSTQGPPRAYYEATAAGREVVRRYIEEALSPQSPVAAALGQVTGELFQRLREDDQGAARG